MYITLLNVHSILRWLVLFSLLLAIYRAFSGYSGNRPFTKTDNAIRHWTATIAHIQLLVGMLLYFRSPIIEAFQNGLGSGGNLQLTFFGVIHPLLMLIAIVMLTLGSAKAKRKALDKDKFKTMVLWFAIALVIILLAIPWPFSPIAGRPYFRGL